MATRFKHPEIRETANRLELWDPIERSTMGFSLPDSVTPEPANADAFYFPVDTAVRFETSLIECEGLHDIHVWTGDGEFVAESTNGEPLFLPHDTYLFDLTGPIKTYFQVDGSLQVLSDGGRSSIAFGGETTVTLGIRSFHDNPAGEIVVDDDPYTLLEAIPFLATSLKTLSPERSFPTMRGHPPRLVRRDSTPEEPLTADLEKPNTGIRLEVPPTFRHLYPIAPLAFYLGADVLPASQPRLRTQSQRIQLQTVHEEYDTAVSRLLQHVFFLDCLTRTEGYFQVPLHEREQFELALRNSREGPDELDFAALYNLPIAERVDRYLEVPFSVFEHLLPEWRLTADVQPEAEYLECLPFLVADLATIRCPNPTPVGSAPQTPQPVQDFFRDGTLEHNSLEFVETPRSNSLEQTFIGESNPLDASKATLESFESRLQRTATDREDIEVAVVRNDDQMEGERAAVSESYGSLEETGATVRFLENCTVADLHTLFTSATDFVHYIGHVDGRGLECADGYFDATAHDEYGVGAFILNGCQSYAQGEALIRGGCIGGVVTASAVLNEPAVEIGGSFARLLVEGFSLRAATSIATDQRIVGNQYLVIGDGEFRVTDEENTTPNLCLLEARDNGRFEVTIETYPTSNKGMGCLITPYLPGVEKRFLTSGRIADLTVAREGLVTYLEQGSFPVKFEDRLLWSDDLLEVLQE